MEKLDYRTLDEQTRYENRKRAIVLIKSGIKKKVVAAQFGVALAVSTMSKYLRSWGFTPQKPKKRAYEQRSVAVLKWLVEDYPVVKKRAKEHGAQIHWGGETGIANSCNHGRSFAPIGQTPTKMSMCKEFSR